MKIRLERTDTQKEITVETLLDSGVMRLVMSSEFTRRQEFKFKNIERLIYVRNLNEMFNKERPIENTVEINISYKEHRKRTEIDVIGGQV